jgi:hypothetical protein
VPVSSCNFHDLNNKIIILLGGHSPTLSEPLNFFLFIICVIIAIITSDIKASFGDQ